MVLKDWKKIGVNVWRNKKTGKSLHIVKSTYGQYNFYRLQLRNKNNILDTEFTPQELGEEEILKLLDAKFLAKKYMIKN